MAKSAAAVSGVPCGVVSAFSEWRSGEENQASHGELLDILLRNGYSPVEARGEWEGVPELCWVVPGITESELLELARDFQQESVVYVDGDGARVVRA